MFPFLGHFDFGKGQESDLMTKVDEDTVSSFYVFTAVTVFLITPYKDPQERGADTQPQSCSRQ